MARVLPLILTLCLAACDGPLQPEPGAAIQAAAEAAAETPAGSASVRWLEQSILDPPRVLELAPRLIRSDRGQSFYISLPEELAALASDGDQVDRSRAVLSEDGRPLGPPNAAHSEIRSQGGGAYSHWGTGLYLSSSDGSDPRENGRRYMLTLPSSARAVRVAESLVSGEWAQYELELPADGEIENLSLVFENVGDTIIDSPWLTHAEGPDWFDAERILAPIRAEASTEAELARALWDFLVRNRRHDDPATHGVDLHDPVRMLNVYGYGFCDDAAEVYQNLGRLLGLDLRTWWLNGHVLSEVFHDGAWHIYDVDMEALYPGPDGNPLSVELMEQEPQRVALPTGPDGYTPSLLSRRQDVIKVVSESYASREDNQIAGSATLMHPDMSFALRPGEKLERWWAGRSPPLVFPGGRSPSAHGSGRWTLKVTLPADSSLPVVTRFRLPYPIVAVEASLPSGSEAQWSLSVWPNTERAWLPLAKTSPAAASPSEQGAVVLRLDLPLPSAKATPNYELVLRAVPGATPAPQECQLVYRVDVQVAPQSLPLLRPGVNRLHYRSNTPGALRISHLYTLP